ncbi:hypothetical protein ACHAW6_001574 [Cyclotella cf. meneghiniana]
MVAVELNCNYIDANCMRSRKTSDLIKAYQTIHQHWHNSQVIHVTWHVLDNEAPRELKATICSNGSTVKLTPPDVHQCNNAKRAIQTFKSHFITILSSADNSFPINEWDSLLPQAILTLNLLCNANVAPKISAYTYCHGPFDYDRMPLAPIRCVLQFHVKTGHRRTWGEHSTDGRYIGASPEHYRTHHIFVKATRSHCLSDTVFFKHKFITQPMVTPADAIVKAFHDLMATLKGTTNLKGQQNLDAITKLQSTLLPPATPLPHSPRVNFATLSNFAPSTLTVLSHRSPQRNRRHHQVHNALSTPALASQMTPTSHPLWTTTALLTTLHNVGAHLGTQPMTTLPRASLPDTATVHKPSLTWRPAKPLNTGNSSVTPNSKMPGTLPLPMNSDALHRV